jgi:hypothetical protein
MNTSAPTHPTEPAPVPTTQIPREQSGVRIFSSADSVCVGDELYFGLVNEGNSTIEFRQGMPFSIQIYENRTWRYLWAGGGTQGFWRLKPGGERGWNFYHVPLFNMSSYMDSFKHGPGLYRIQFFWGRYGNKRTVRRCNGNHDEGLLNNSSKWFIILPVSDSMRRRQVKSQVCGSFVPPWRQ